MITSPANGKKLRATLLTNNNVNPIWGYDTKSGYYAPQFIETGKGYWAFLRSDKSIAVKATDLDLESSASVALDDIMSSVVSGKWSLLGTPFEVTRTELKTRGAVAVWYYSPAIGNYSTEDVINANSGFWIIK
jgi:hypothetical protein